MTTEPKKYSIFQNRMEARLRDALRGYIGQYPTAATCTAMAKTVAGLLPSPPPPRVEVTTEWLRFPWYKRAFLFLFNRRRMRDAKYRFLCDCYFTETRKVKYED